MSAQNLIEKLIYSLSHDLRSPVASIQGLVRIAEYYPRHDEIHKCLGMIEDCTHKMNKLMSNLQEYVTNLNSPLVVEPMNAKELIELATAEFKNQFSACNIELIVDAQSGSPWAIDKKGTLKILEHLISNAIAYHDPSKMEKKIIVRLESNEHSSILEVYDNGKGIAIDHQEKIFDVFFKGTEHSIGLGMGLFLVQGLVEKMGGTVVCKSDLNKDTSIYIEFENH